MTLVGIKMLFLLRVGLSKAIKNHNCLDTPSEICDGGGNEDTIHFYINIYIKYINHNNLEHLSHDELTHQ